MHKPISATYPKVIKTKGNPTSPQSSTAVLKQKMPWETKHLNRIQID
jgi:hypothetical protein